MLVLATTLIYTTNASRSRLARAMDNASELDPGWRLAELESKRDRLTDEENGAVVVQKVFAEIPADWLSVAPPDVERGGPFRGWPLYRELTESVADPTALLEEGFANGLRAEVNDLSSAMRLARPLAEMHSGRYPLAYASNPFATLLTHVQDARQVARLLQLDALARAHDNEIDGALRSCRAILGVARAIGDEPMMISQLVRIAIVTMEMNTIERVLALGEASDEALEKVQADLAEEEAFPRLITAMRGERALQFEAFEGLAAGRYGVAGLDGTSGAGRSTLERALGPLTIPFYRYNQALLLDAMTEAVEIAKLPLEDRAASVKAFELKFARRPTGTVAQLSTMLVYMVMPAYAVAFDADRRITGQLRTMQTLLALERMRLRTKRWAESTGAIPAELLPKPLLDPFDGKPVHIAPREDGITVYVVGPDAEDNGGKLDPRMRPNEVGFDWGYRLWNASARRNRSRNTHDLPDDVFAKDSE